MIQRVQSVFLLLAAGISVLLLYLPVYEMVPVDTQAATEAAVVKFSLSSSAILLILNGAIGVFSFLAIFLFRKRNLQIRLCNLLLLLTCILIGLLFFVADMSTGMNQRIQYLYGSYLPLIQILFIFLASRFIRKDEELVRSAGRLR